MKFLLLGFILFLSFTLMAQDDDRIVVAQPGEGVYSILRRMEMDAELYHKSFIELNLDNLTSDSALIAGNIYILPEEMVSVKSDDAVVHRVKSYVYPIFGPKYENVELKSNKLEGTIYYLVSGHGGPDPGAVGKYGGKTVSEDEYAYDVTLRLARNLIADGAEVIIVIQDPNDGIRDDAVLSMDKDEEAYPHQKIPANQRSRLKQRTDMINSMYAKNKGKYQRLITIHVDSRSQGQNIDVFFYHHYKSKNGKKLAESIQQTFKSKYAQHQPGRQYHGTVTTRSGLYMIRNTHLPMVYIELGNIQNARDQRRLVLNSNRQAVANWIAEGIMKDFHSSK